MSKLTAVARVTLGEQVAVQIAGMIAQGRWRPGDKLPPEMELCTVLGVGRSTLREALKSLAFVGYVRMRAGDGTYVAEPTRGILDQIFARGFLKTEKDLADVCETRMVLETELAALAAERAKEEDTAMLADLISAGEKTLKERADFTSIDVDFHLAVARCSKNNLLPRLLMDVRTLLAEWITKSQELPGMRENAQKQHRRIYKSIAARDRERAREEMRAHLNTFQKAYKLLGKLSDKLPSDAYLPATGKSRAAQARYL